MTLSETFALATESLLDCAATHCAAHGAQLTPLRRAVLGLVIEHPRPAGAYDLLAALTERAGRTAPPTVYRALDFLLTEGLIHKIERLAAYVACTHHLRHDHHHPAHAQSVQFLICTKCGAALELEDTAIGQALTRASTKAGFAVRAATIEAEGICAGCSTGL